MSKLFSLAGKTAIVTGAGRGIGRAIAIGLAEAGAQIVLVSRTEAQLKETEAAILAETDVKTLVATCDVTDQAAVQAVVAQTVETFGAVDILVNNAGINYKKTFLEVTTEDWETIVHTNLTGEFLFAHAVAEQMAKQGGGRIINMASVGGILGLSKTAPYCASKGGIMQMTKVMAIDLASYHINVNAICPGYIDTGLLKEPAQKQMMMENLSKYTPMGRPGLAEDLVGAAVFLASDAANYVTGTSIVVDGGMSCIAM